MQVHLYLITLLTAAGAFAQAGVEPLGPASAFDVWGTTGVELEHVSIAGRVCSNKVLSLDCFAVAQDPGIDAGSDSVVSGGLLFMRVGGVSRGQVVYQTLLDVDNTVGLGNGLQGPRQEDRFDDELLRRVLEHQATELGLQQPTGEATLVGPDLLLEGTLPGLNVFELSPEEIGQATQVHVLIPAGAAALVNVKGGIWEQAAWSLQLGGTDPSRVLFNAYERTDLLLSQTQLGASLLAPRASLWLDQIGIVGQVVGRYVLMEHGHTVGQHLAGSEWLVSGAGFEPDEDGRDEASYSLVWTETPGANIELQAMGSSGLALIVDGVERTRVQRARVSRIVLGEGIDPSSTLVESSLAVPVEWVDQRPVAMDDRAVLPRGAWSVEVPILENDLGVALDPSSVEIVQAPRQGIASVDVNTGVLTYTRPPLGPGRNVAPWAHDVIWYQVQDSRGIPCLPRRVLISLGSARGLQVR